MTPSITLAFPDAPPTAFAVAGHGFPPGSWIWVTVEDLTTGVQVVDGPDAFQPDPDGAFRLSRPPVPAAGHVHQARAFVDNQVVARSGPIPAPVAPIADDPADPDAGAAARAVLRDLQSAPQRLERRLVVGQALRGWDDDRPPDQPVTALSALGLPTPWLVEVDLTDFAAHGDALVDLLVRHAHRGGVVGLSFHAGNPFTGGGVGDRRDVDLPQLRDPADPRTAAGWAWRAALDGVADVMARLGDAVILFRPLHESNGDWFWWGQREPADFAAVWWGMLRYLTEVRGLHHLLWVYSANRNFGGELLDPRRLYPGDGAVDVVGLDIYHDDLSDADSGAPGYAALVALGKPFAITEYGAANWPVVHDGAVYLPNDEVVRTLRERYPLTVLACAWYSTNGNNWQISDKPQPGALLRDPWAVTLPAAP